MDRARALDELATHTFDLLVVGGGITGAGVALDAVSRGLSVALVERDDFASGTSSRSSKLIHGGLRYLQHLEFGLVREGLTERRRIAEAAPYLVRVLPFVIPRIGHRPMPDTWAGLWTYDALSVGSRFPRHDRIDASEATWLAPALDGGIRGGFVYWDAQTDDARLTWTVVRTAAERGAVAVNHAELTAFIDQRGRAAGALVRDRRAGRELEIRARAIVNATGVWADRVGGLEHPERPRLMRPSKGIHLVFDACRIPVRSAVLVPAPERRYVFIIPFLEGRVLVGTTDDDYTGPMDHPHAEPSEIAYLLDIVNAVLAAPVTADDVVAAFAGLRPLLAADGAPAKDLSRRHAVSVGPRGVVTVTGGKLTTYRRMAAEAVDAALETGGFDRRPPSATARLPLAGASPGRIRLLDAARDAGLTPEQIPRLYERYGSRAHDVIAFAAREPGLLEPLHPDLPYLRAEAAYAIDAEGAERPDDVLSRRLRVRISSRDRGLSALDWVVGRLRARRGWTEEFANDEAGAYEASIRTELRAERG